MVRSALLALSALLASSCTVESASERMLRDSMIGIVEVDGYRFSADDGLLHVREATASTLTLRAAATEFSGRITRKDPALTSVQLRVANLPDAPSLIIGGSTVAGTADPALSRGYWWTVSFSPGIDEVSILASALAPQSFRFVAFGDIQGGIDRFQDMVNAVNTEATAEFALMLGDLTNRATFDEFNEVEGYFRQLRFPVYVTPGNHDVFRKREFQDFYGRANYSFTHRGARLTSVDSASAELDPVAWDWARAWMDLGAATGHVVFTHIPVIESSGIRSGQWNSRREAAKFLAMARQRGVDLLLFGHIHSYDAYELAGIPTRISGGCGAIEEKLDGIDRHYLRVDYDSASGSFRTEAVRIE